MDHGKHIKHLNEFRATMVAERQSLAKALSAKKGRTAKARDEFVAVQEAIEAIDRALLDAHPIRNKSKPPAKTSARLQAD
jgi:hypothetical protein